MRPSRIQAIDDVHLEGLPSLEEDLRWFYGEAGELREIDPPQGSPKQLLFKSEQIELRVLLLDQPTVEPVACRICIAVTSLAALEELLEEGRFEYERLRGLGYTSDQIQVLDPAGNRVAFRQDWGNQCF